MIPLKARQVRFCRWFVDLPDARAVGKRRVAAKPASLPARFVYFCFGKNSFNINALTAIRVYFCIPARKGDSSKIRDLARKNVNFCILLYTFHIRSDWVLLRINGLSATEV